MVWFEGEGGEKMDVELTKESRKVLKEIYDVYLERRKLGQSKKSAIYFPGSVKLNIEGIEDAKKELSNAKMIVCDIVDGFELKDKAIIFMENFTKDSVLKWLDFGSKFVP